MDSGDIVLMMRSKNPDMLALFFSLPFLLFSSDSSFWGRKEKKRGREIELKLYCFEETRFLRSTFQLNDAFGRPFPTRVRNAVPISSTLYNTTVRFLFFFFVSASSLFQKPNPSAQKYIYLHKKDLRQQVISKLSTLRGQNAHGILDCRCSSARCRRQGGCALLTSFVVLLWG